MIIGIDVSKDKLDIYILSMNKYHKIKNTKAGITSFFKNKLNSSEMTLVVFESTGSYGKTLQLYLMSQHIPFHRAHPSRVRKFAEGKGYFAKTDRIDAHVLARYGEQPEIKPNDKRNKKQLEIQEYSSRRTQLKNLITSEKQRLKHTYFCPDILRSIKRNIKQLERELDIVSDKLTTLINADDVLREKRDLLKTTKGIGPEVALLLVTDLPELGHLSREEIAHLVGVAPQTQDSGKKQGYRSISRGRFYVRKALYMSALVAVRFNPRMKKIYDRLLARGKLKKVALVAVMRKMIIMLNTMLKNQAVWQPDRV